MNEGAEEAAGFADFLLKNEKVRHAASLTAAALGVVETTEIGGTEAAPPLLPPPRVAVKVEDGEGEEEGEEE